MNEIIKVVCIAVCGAILVGVFKSVRHEYAYIISISCALLVLCLTLPKIISLIGEIKSLFPLSDLSSEGLRIFFKCVIICEVCSLTKSFCRDSSNSFLASCVDLSEKAAILVISMPLIESVIKIIANFIGK